ncbi:helix-turn-helix domain-containing protein [Actinomadura citrea]|uniref:helix-turn-helix domain-containing protein n=1 Tax=Actinomadura citrea TaxID=46158 RepID=UPI002E2BA1C3|nr:helix-turn-helix domain-containing protein [Actinomadura citrea]
MNTLITPDSDLLLTVEEAARRLKIGRTQMYSLITSGEVQSVTIGRLRRVPAECLTAYVSGLMAAAQHN